MYLDLYKFLTLVLAVMYSRTLIAIRSTIVTIYMYVFRVCIDRRSVRNNGQQPELSITDPVKLERRLKRQRGEECIGGNSHGSKEETVGAGE